jgi:hypothetical protein
VFFCQNPSFLAHQKLLYQNQGTNNAHTLFGVDTLPTDNHVRNLLDPVEPKKLRGVFRNTFPIPDAAEPQYPNLSLLQSILVFG